MLITSAWGWISGPICSSTFAITCGFTESTRISAWRATSTLSATVRTP